MPSTSKKQHRLMAAVAHNPSFAKKVGIPQSVGRDFTEADKGRKFAKGGDMAKKLPPFMGKETKAEEAKEMKIKRMSPALYKKGEKAEGVHGKSGMEKPTKYAKGGFTRAADGVATKGRTKAQRFAGGGMLGDAPQAMTPAQRPLPPAPVAPVSTTATAPGPKIAPYVKGYGTPGYGAPAPTNISAPPQFPVAPAAPAPQPSQARPTNPFTNPKQYQAEQALQSTARPPVNQRIDSMLNQMSAQRQLDNQMAAKMQAKQQLTELMAAKNKAKPAPAPYQKPGPAATNYGNPGGPVMRGGPSSFAMPVFEPRSNPLDVPPQGIKKGGVAKTFAKGGSIDGCATKGKTKGRYI